MNLLKRINKNNFTFFIILLLVNVFPDYIYYTLGVGNFSLSVILAIILALPLVINKAIDKNILLLMFLFILFIFSNILSGFFFYNVGYLDEKIIFSVFSISLLFLFSLMLSKKILSFSEETIIQSVSTMYFLLTGCGLFAAIMVRLGLNPDKNMILFSEPSAFALIYIPFFAFYLHYSRDFKTIGVIFLAFFISLLVQNLTLMVGIILTTVLVKRIKITYILLPALCVSMVIYIYGNLYDFSYFTDRLNFVNSTNLSVLVYVSGVERAFLNLIDSNGIGIGFQQMGMNGIIGDSQKKLQLFDAGQLNLFDGSFISSKFISEFGAIGFIICVLYVLFTLYSVANFKRKTKISAHNVLFYCFMISFLVPLFVRGAGYINPYVIMFFCSCYGYFMSRKYNGSLP